MADNYKITQYTVNNILGYVESSQIAIPEIQRPFVWKDNKVRDLFDSMLRGYPIGYVMLWESPTGYDEKKSSIGGNKKIYEEPRSWSLMASRD